METKVTSEQDLWYMDAVFYEVQVRSIYDSNGDGKGDITGLTERLDYFQALGVDCLWLLPMYPSPLRDDGYDIAEFTTLHPDFGTVEEFQHFLTEAHRRGLKVIADLVLNHTSDQHPWFQAALLDPKSRYRDFYVWSADPTLYQTARIIFVDTERSNWTLDPLSGEYYWHRFFWHQPDLNYDNPAVHDAMFDVARFWLDMGLDGFRCDAVPYLYERDGTSCENLPETHQFIRNLRNMVDIEYPGKVLLAEANQWPEDVIPYFGTPEEPEFQMNFHFPVMPRIYMSIRRHDRTSLVDIIDRTPAPPPDCQWATFLRNHDELTLEMVLPEERQYMWREYAPEMRMRSNLGIRRRLAPLMDNSRARIELMNALVLSLPGAPCLYYGDEIGMGDDIWLRDRNGVRTPMQWSGERNAGFSASSEFWAPVIDRGEFGYERVNVNDQTEQTGSLLNWTRQMLSVRRGLRAISRGSFEFVNPEQMEVTAYLREYYDQRLLCLANLGDKAISTALDLAQFAGMEVRDAIGGNPFHPIDMDPWPVTLAPYGYYWLTISPAEDAC